MKDVFFYVVFVVYNHHYDDKKTEMFFFCLNFYPNLLNSLGSVKKTNTKKIKLKDHILITHKRGLLGLCFVQILCMFDTTKEKVFSTELTQDAYKFHSFKMNRKL